MTTRSSRVSGADTRESRRTKLTQLIKRVVPNAHQLPYPENGIPLHSLEGLERLENSIGSFDKLAVCFEPQGPLQCAVTSLTIALNMCRPSGASRISMSQLQEELRNELQPAHRFFSVSLGEIGKLAERYAGAQTVYASDTDCNTFRILASEVLADGGSVVANFKRSELGYASPFSGHCSPLGAYNPSSDEFLVMDVAVKSFQPVWVAAELIFKGMNTIEKPRDEFAVGTKSRGFILIDPYEAPHAARLNPWESHEHLSVTKLLNDMPISVVVL